jgi:hypothetical protein
LIYRIFLSAEPGALREKGLKLSWWLKYRSPAEVISVLSGRALQTLLRSSPILTQRAYLGHLHYFTKETAIATLHEAGYEITDLFYTHLVTEEPASLPARRMALPSRIGIRLNEDFTVRLLGRASLMVLCR